MNVIRVLPSRPVTLGSLEFTPLTLVGAKMGGETPNLSPVARPRVPLVTRLPPKVRPLVGVGPLINGEMEPRVGLARMVLWTVLLSIPFEPRIKTFLVI